MKLASFKIGNNSTWGVIENEEAIDVGALLRDRYPDLKSAIAADALPAARDGTSKAKRYPTADIAWLWLKPGDIVEVEIDRLGVLRNGVADET
jgi:hypothetical protein